jgi:hypothetical protein
MTRLPEKRGRWPHRLFDFLLYDEARLIEIVSACNLAAWAWAVWYSPSLLQRDSYIAFQSMPHVGWIVIFGVVAALQWFSMLSRHPHRREFRFVAMALAAGCWTAIAANFITNGLSTTANMNYLLLALATAIAGGFLGWKTSSST